MRYVWLLIVVLLTCCSPKFFPKYSSAAGVHPPERTAVLFLNFNGDIADRFYWLRGRAVIVDSSELDPIEREIVTKVVAESFSPFNILVTTSDSIYNTTPKAYRAKVNITSSEPFNKEDCAGEALLGSYVWRDDTPAYVFEHGAGDDPVDIASAVSHEAGHMFGLKHKSLWLDSFMLYEYDPGKGPDTARLSVAPIMGTGYQKSFNVWTVGSTPDGDDCIQNDVEVLGNVLGMKKDDVGNDPRHAHQLETGEEFTGIIGSSQDVDFFKFDVGSTKHVLVNVYPENYDHRGMALYTHVSVFSGHGKKIYDNAEDESPWVFKWLNLVPDRYYIQVENRASKYGPREQYIGTYHIMIR